MKNLLHPSNQLIFLAPTLFHRGGAIDLAIILESLRNLFWLSEHP